MSQNEVMAMEMLKDLVEMSEESFQKCVEYAENMEATERVKNFLDVLIMTELIERKKTIQTAQTAHKNCLNHKEYLVKILQGTPIKKASWE